MLCLHLPSHQPPCLRSLWFIPLHKVFVFTLFIEHIKDICDKVQRLFSFHPFSLVFCSPLSPSTFIGPLQLCPRQYSHMSSLSTFLIYIDYRFPADLHIMQPQLYEMNFQEDEHFPKPKHNSQHICQP